MRQTLHCILLFTISISLCAQQSSDRDRPGHSATPRVKVDTKPLPPNAVIVRNGSAYISVEALAKALNSSVISRDGTLEIATPASPTPDCATDSDSIQLSDEFRNAAVRIPDEIEALRSLVAKYPTAAIATKFDEIDALILRSGFYIRSEEDRSIYYALSRANNSLAIMYWKLMQQIPPEEAQRNQLDSVLCSTESKFALLIGHLSGKESCSVFERYRNQQDTSASKK